MNTIKDEIEMKSSFQNFPRFYLVNSRKYIIEQVLKIGIYNKWGHYTYVGKIHTAQTIQNQKAEYNTLKKNIRCNLYKL